MTKITVDVKPRNIISAYVVAPFDRGKELLEKERYAIISLEENARLRLQEGVNASVSLYGNWTREDVVYIPGKRIYLTKNSPIIHNAKEATDAHRNGKDFYLTDEQIVSSLEGAVVLNGKSIPTNRINENESRLELDNTKN